MFLNEKKEVRVLIRSKTFHLKPYPGTAGAEQVRLGERTDATCLVKVDGHAAEVRYLHPALGQNLKVVLVTF